MRVANHNFVCVFLGNEHPPLTCFEAFRRNMTGYNPYHYLLPGESDYFVYVCHESDYTNADYCLVPLCAWFLPEINWEQLEMEKMAHLLRIGKGGT